MRGSQKVLLIIIPALKGKEAGEEKLRIHIKDNWKTFLNGTSLTE